MMVFLRSARHVTAFLAGFILDLIIGDPHGFPHPIRFIGWLISKLEKVLYGGENLLARGGVLVFIVLTVITNLANAILFGAYFVHPICGIIIEAVMTWQILAMKSLRVESMKVYQKMDSNIPESERLDGARKAVSMIVGRDTDCLNEEGIIKAAVETVAENTSDGVIAPLLCLAIGGPVLGFAYKAINTMDSMIGYKNDRYLLFGRAAAKIDDVVNFIPSRMAALFMIAAAHIGGRDFDGKGALKIWKRDRKKHASPNSAQTEAVCAGALGVRLAGDAVYFGKTVKKPFIGDAIRQIERKDIARANKLMYITAFLCMGVCLVILCTAVIFTGIKLNWTFQ